MITVTLYIREQSPECDQAVADLRSLRETVPHQLVVINVDQQPALKDKIGPDLPVAEIGPYHLTPPFTRQDLQIMLSAARDRVDQLERVDQETYQKRLTKGHTLTAGDKITHFLSHHYLLLLNLAIFIYAGLPFLAPVLMENGGTGAAAVIYKIYSPMCHQLAFRSWFLFGEQAYYPRELAGIPGVLSYEKITNSQQVDVFEARNFDGNQTLGFKVALCERDVAIYGAMLLFGLVFAFTGRRMRAVPWYLWVVFGLIPIGLDGFSQLPSLITGLPSWLIMRESTPLLRTLTGGMFGWMTAWYLFPMIEETAKEACYIIQRKMLVIQQGGQLNQP